MRRCLQTLKKATGFTSVCVHPVVNGMFPFYKTLAQLTRSQLPFGHRSLQLGAQRSLGHRAGRPLLGFREMAGMVEVLIAVVFHPHGHRVSWHVR